MGEYVCVKMGGTSNTCARPAPVQGWNLLGWVGARGLTLGAGVKIRVALVLRSLGEGLPSPGVVVQAGEAVRGSIGGHDASGSQERAHAARKIQGRGEGQAREESCEHMHLPGN